jgi:hypothetical protein
LRRAHSALTPPVEPLKVEPIAVAPSWRLACNSFVTTGTIPPTITMFGTQTLAPSKAAPSA